MSQRSFKANNLNAWVNALINNDAKEALKLSIKIKENYPLYITRNIGIAKEWLRQKKSGNKRIGLVASSALYVLSPMGFMCEMKLMNQCGS